MPPQHISGFPPAGPRRSPASVPAYSSAPPISKTPIPNPLFQAPQQALKNTVTQAINRLPVVRRITYRPDKSITNTDRSGNVQALLGYERGSEAATPCERCRAGRGVFPKCVVLNGHFGGSCTNCRSNDQTNMCSFHVIDVNNFGGCVKRKVTSAKKPQSPQTKRQRADEDVDYDFAEPVKTVPTSSRPTAYTGTSKCQSRRLEDQKKIVVQHKRPVASKSLLAQAIDAADEDKLWSVILDLCQNIPNATDIVIKNLARTISTDTIHVDNRSASNKQQRLYTTPQLERLLKETIPLPKKAETNQKRKGIDDGEAGTQATHKRRAVPVEEDAEAPLCEVCGELWR